jgi:hypothetical protein
LLPFNRDGDCLAAKLRPGNVHSAEGWEELLLPEIERQQQTGKEVVFRTDAAFAKPETYEALEEREVKYAIRLPANHNLQRNLTELLTPAGGRSSSNRWSGSRAFYTSGSQLEDVTAGGGEGRVSLWGIVPPRGLYRHQPRGNEPRGGALLQQARHGLAMDQGRQAGGEDDAAFLSPLPHQ